MPPGALPAGLQAGLPRKHHHQVLADLQEGPGQRPLESLPVGQEQHQRSHAPDNAQHRQHRPQPVMGQRPKGLAKDMANHSYLSASTGASRDARRAG